MEHYITLIGFILLGAEFIATSTGILYYNSVKRTPWKWFVLYLSFIFTQELYFQFNSDLYIFTQQEYYAFIGIPIQFLFFYWLFAKHSLKREKLFILSSLLYLSSIPIDYHFNQLHAVCSNSFIAGTIILSILAVMEFIKQIKSNEILNFRENKMFYIVVGILLAYIGSLPFFAFYKELYENYRQVWNVYFFYFKGSNIVMYLLFAASFIWGKR